MIRVDKTAMIGARIGSAFDPGSIEPVDRRLPMKAHSGTLAR
jgi:hypothetical protein